MVQFRGDMSVHVMHTSGSDLESVPMILDPTGYSEALKYGPSALFGTYAGFVMSETSV